MKNPNYWTNPQTEYALLVHERDRAYRTGKALISHTNAQHGGKVDLNCIACKAITQKQDSLSK